MGKSVSDLNILRFGQAGLALGASVRGHEDILSDIDVAELKGLVASHELFMAQHADWRKYCAGYNKDPHKPGQKEMEASAPFVENLIKQLEKYKPVIDGQIPRMLAELLHEAEDIAFKASIQVWGLKNSAENVLIALVQKAMDYAKSDRAGFVRDYLKGVGETLNKGSQRAVAATIFAVIVKASDFLGQSVFHTSWMKAAMEFVKALIKNA